MVRVTREERREYMNSVDLRWGVFFLCIQDYSNTIFISPYIKISDLDFIRGWDRLREHRGPLAVNLSPITL